MTEAKTRVFVCTDLNTVGGDPDDQQSMAHVLLYGDELDVVGVAPDRWGAGGYEETKRIIEEKYRLDYENPDYRFREYGYPEPETMAERVATDPEGARDALVREAERARADGVPLYVVVWGQLVTVRDALRADPSLTDAIRLISIGTNVKRKGSGGDGIEGNWNNGDNGAREYVWEHGADLWWLEVDWTYTGFIRGGPDYTPEQFLDGIASDDHGELAQYVEDCVEGFEYAEGKVRAGDTPSVLYLVDPDNDLDDPTRGSWAGRYAQPFDDRPYYYTGISGGHEWDYRNPANTWENAEAVFEARIETIRNSYAEMADAFVEKLDDVYGVD